MCVADKCLPGMLQLGSQDRRLEFEVLFEELSAWKAIYRTTLVPRQACQQPCSAWSSGCTSCLTHLLSRGKPSTFCLLLLLEAWQEETFASCCVHADSRRTYALPKHSDHIKTHIMLGP